METRTLDVTEAPLQSRMARDIAQTDAYVLSRRERKKVEMLFAHLKRILRLDRLRLRGPNAPETSSTSPQQPRTSGSSQSFCRTAPAGKSQLVIASLAGRLLQRYLFIVEDAAVVRSGHRAQLDAAVFDLEGLDLLGSVRAQAELDMNAG